MSEQSARVGLHALDQNTMAGPVIVACLDNFTGSLPRDRRQEFRTLDYRDQIDQACWELAQRNPDDARSPTLHKAVNLRAMQALYSLESHLADESPNREWDYMMAVYENPFWQAVDSTFERFIAKMAHDKFSQHVAPLRLMPAVNGEDAREVPLCVLNDTKVSKRIRFGRCLSIINLVYIAEPVSPSA